MTTVYVPLATVDVAVRFANGKPAPLTVDDFRVVDDGLVQSAAYVALAQPTKTLWMTVGELAPALIKAWASGVGEMAREIGRHDPMDRIGWANLASARYKFGEFRLLSCPCHLTLFPRASTHVPSTNDEGDAARWVSRIPNQHNNYQWRSGRVPDTPGVAGDVYTGLDWALRQLDREEGRRAIVVLTTDDQEMGSRESFDRLIGLAGRHTTPMYFVITTRSLTSVRAGQNAAVAIRVLPELDAIARASGGRALAASTAGDFIGHMGTIARELARTYTVAFAPARADGQTHEVRVDLTGDELLKRVAAKDRPRVLAERGVTRRPIRQEYVAPTSSIKAPAVP
jgi:hypothetical protein